MKILVVPSDRITDHTVTRGMTFRYAAKAVLRARLGEARDAFAQKYCSEIQWFGDLPRVIGRDNTIIVGRYHPGYVTKKLPPDTWCASLHGVPKGRHVSPAAAQDLMPGVDAVLIGARSGEVGETIRRKALAKGIFVAVIDFFDDEDLFHSREPARLCRDLERDRDFNLYFKLSLPKGMRERNVLPLCLNPIRIENFPSDVRPFEDRDIPVFYRGTLVLKKRPERLEMADRIRHAIQGSVIQDVRQVADGSLAAYWNAMARSRIAFSPAGKVWDTARHAELAAFGCVPLLPEPDIETVRDLVRDGENAIVYQTFEDDEGEVRVKAPEEVLERVRILLDDTRECERLARNWRAEILANHTTESRARYIADEIAARL